MYNSTVYALNMIKIITLEKTGYELIIHFYNYKKEDY